MLGEGPGTAGKDFYCCYRSAESTHNCTQPACCVLVIYKLLEHKFTYMGEVTLVLTTGICGHRIAV